MPEINIVGLKQFQELIASDIAVVRYTASWCGPCRRMQPEIINLAKETYEPNVKFLSIDIDFAQEEAELKSLLSNVRSVPTFHFYKNGQLIGKFD
jgi:thioredoxin 1